MGKLFELTFDLWIARLLCAFFALRSPCAIVFGTWRHCALVPEFQSKNG
jgi:hypothetical protein